eukprot:COSAG02_NODE_547_length_20492_cov_265.508802_12_plen_176_part_00
MPLTREMSVGLDRQSTVPPDDPRVPMTNPTPPGPIGEAVAAEQRKETVPKTFRVSSSRSADEADRRTRVLLCSLSMSACTRADEPQLDIQAVYDRSARLERGGGRGSASSLGTGTCTRRTRTTPSTTAGRAPARTAWTTYGRTTSASVRCLSATARVSPSAFHVVSHVDLHVWAS